MNAQASEQLDTRREAERKKHHQRMRCTVCGESYVGRQWYNQDNGYGLGDCCTEHYNHSVEIYGFDGIHFNIPRCEKSPTNPNVGRPVIEGEPRVRIDGIGYVYWKGNQVDHWSHNLTKPGDPQAITHANLLISRAEHLESTDKPVTAITLWWTWKEPK